MSHDWKYSSEDNAAEKCPECHAEVAAEILSMPAGSPHRQLYVENDCSVCHRNESAGFEPGTMHTVTLPECTWCHNTTEPERDGDGVYGIKNLSASTEAHKPMYENATGWVHDPGKNRACLACHTRATVEVIFNRPQWYNFTIDSSWAITNVDTGPLHQGGSYTINFTTNDLGKHYWLEYI